MRVLVLVALAVGAALAAGGAIFAFLGFSGSQAAVVAYVASCLVPDASALCPSLRSQVDMRDTVMLVGLILTFVGADLLVLGALFHVSPTFRRIIPAPR